MSSLVCVVLLALLGTSFVDAKCSKKANNKIQELFKKFEVKEWVDAKKCPRYDDGQFRFEYPVKKWKTSCWKLKEKDAEEQCKEKFDEPNEADDVDCCVRGYDAALKMLKSGKCDWEGLRYQPDFDGCSDFFTDPDRYGANLAKQDCCYTPFDNVECKSKNRKKLGKTKFLKKLKKVLKGDCHKWEDSKTGITMEITPDLDTCPSSSFDIKDYCKKNLRDFNYESPEDLGCCMLGYEKTKQRCEVNGWTSQECLTRHEPDPDCDFIWLPHYSGERIAYLGCYLDSVSDSLADKMCTSSYKAVLKKTDPLYWVGSRRCFANAYMATREACNKSCGGCEDFDYEEEDCSSEAIREGISTARRECCPDN